jgi:hypothetical protein
MYRRVTFPARSLRPCAYSRSVVGALAALLLLVAVRPVGAQGTARGTVAGTVVDDSTGAPIVRATVLVVGTTRGTLTDDRGRFVIGDVAAGERTLRARILSHRPRDVAVVVVAGDTVAITIRLVVAPVTLGAVRARARPPERDRFELAPNVGTVTLTPSAMSGVPALGEPDVLRTVQLLPGVNARNDFSSGYNVRGGRATRISSSSMAIRSTIRFTSVGCSAPSSRRRSARSSCSPEDSARATADGCRACSTCARPSRRAPGSTARPASR